MKKIVSFLLIVTLVFGLVAFPVSAETVQEQIVSRAYEDSAKTFFLQTE